MVEGEVEQCRKQWREGEGGQWQREKWSNGGKEMEEGEAMTEGGGPTKRGDDKATVSEWETLLMKSNMMWLLSSRTPFTATPLSSLSLTWQTNKATLRHQRHTIDF
jgi:hypothetical protein